LPLGEQVTAHGTDLTGFSVHDACTLEDRSGRAATASRSSVEFCVPSDDGRVIEVGFDIGSHTSHALRHLLASQIDPRTGRRLSCARRSLLERTLAATGAAIERLEVLPGEPPRLALATVTSNAVVRRIDVDLLDAAELLASHRIPAVAVGWPERDWDVGLRELLA
jgi:hypothetical protein